MKNTLKYLSWGAAGLMSGLTLAQVILVSAERAGGNPGGDEPGNEEKPGEDEKKGCGSSIAVSSAISGGIVLLAAVAITLTLRKKED